MDKLRKFSPEQSKTFKLAMNSHENGCRGVFCMGSYRAGKTFIACYTLIAFIQKYHKNSLKKGQKAFLLGSTKQKLQKQVVPVLISILDYYNYPYYYNHTYQLGGPFIEVFGTQIHLFNGEDVDSATYIQGEEFVAGVVDELTNLNKDCLDMLITRLNPEPNFVTFTYNAAPERWHWVITDFLPDCKRIGFEEIQFKLENNPGISQRFVDDSKSYLQEGSAKFKRLYLGEWVPGEGLVYNFEPYTTTDKFEKPNHSVLAIDHGAKNPTVGLLFRGKKKREYIIEGEYFYDQKRNGNIRKTCFEYITELNNKFPFKDLDWIVLDQKAYDMSTELTNYIKQMDKVDRPKQLPSISDIDRGIAHTQQCMDLGWIKINEQECPNLLRQLSGYGWKNLNGKEIPVDVENDGPDAMRYGVMRLFTLYKDILKIKGNYVSETS